MKKILKFFWEYNLFSLAVLVGIAGLVLQFTHHPSILHWLLGIVATFEVIPLLWGMVQDLRDGTYGIDILAATAIISAVLFKQFWAALVIVIMLTGGEALEDYAETRAKTELNALLSRAPKQAHVLKGSNVVDVSVSAVKANDKLEIRVGEVVPVDAEILDGTASFDESSLTGESLPQSKKPGEQLLSGSINMDGVVTVRALREAADSQYEQIIKLVRAASNSQSPFVRLADRYSIPFTAISFFIAIGAAVVSHQSIRFLEVLTVATPCPLILAAPIAVISGMSRAAKHGVIVKTGSALERFAETETIGFDKTGTLTEGKLVVDNVQPLNGFTKTEVLSLAAALEQSSNHVVAAAIVRASTKQGLKQPKAKNVKEQPGIGLSAQIRGQQILVGGLALLREHKVDLPKKVIKKDVQKTAVYVAVDGKVAGIIALSDEVRPESRRTLDELKKLGVGHLLMVTGDNTATAKAIAKSLGIKDVIAEALPADKLKALENIPDSQRPTAFVGDGVNDAPVLMAADVGIALGARGETAASESADMVILDDNVSRVAEALAIAKHTFAIAQQSIFVGIALSIVLMLIFSTGHFRPLYGAILQEGVDVVVIFNALRAHRDAKMLHPRLKSARTAATAKA